MKKNLSVSFIVIAYNEENNIEEAINSILKQDELSNNFELIVVNDGSKDNTLKILNNKYGNNRFVNILNLQPNRGRGAARYAGVKEAKGDYIAFVDADIILPKHWLKECRLTIGEFDACGGVAVPDGDVAFVHRFFLLEPKVIPQTTTVTGSNGFFSKSVFKKINFNPDNRYGEDTELGYRMRRMGIRTKLLDDLVVKHAESKSFLETISWLYVNGIGASRQLFKYKRIRTPDLAYIGFVATLFASLILIFIGYYFLSITILIAYIFLTSTLHINSKFYFLFKPKYILRYVMGVLCNMPFMLSYYIGRTFGLIKRT